LVKLKPNPRVRNFLIGGMALGFFIIIGGEFESEGRSLFDGLSLVPFDILSVEQDPVTGAIKGNVIFGNADFVASIFTGTKKSTNCPGGVASVSIQDSGKSIRFGSGSSSGGCTSGIAEWGLELLPDDLTVSSITFKMKDELRPTGFNNRNCKIGIIEQPFSTIDRSQLTQKAINPDFVIESGNWCETSGVKTFIFDQTALDAFDRALTGDDKFTLGFSVDPWIKGSGCCWTGDRNFWGTEGSFIINGFAQPISCPVGEHQVQFKCEPLICEVGFEINGNICSQIICKVGENLVGSICKPIQCLVGERLVGNLCEQIICAVGTTLIGSSCQPILCEEGFTLSGNECTVIICPTGTELLEGSCKQITCGLGTFLQGNDCVKISCPTGNVLEGNTCVQIQCEIGENLIGSICTPVQCQVGEQLIDGNCQLITCATGEELIGSECTPVQCLSNEILVGETCFSQPLNCPVGTLERQNICIQQAPLPPLQISGAPLNVLTLLGLGVFLISFGGFVVRGIVRRSIR